MQPAKRLAIVGHGKMGRLIEQLAPDFGFYVALALDVADNADASGITAEAFDNIDVAVEFSTPEAAPRNLMRLAAAKVPAVTGTTGWLQHLPEVTAAVEESGTALVWSPNFSVGVAVFRKLAARIAELLRDEPEYGAWAWEIHHDAKKDAPSGTLLALVRTMEESGYGRTIDMSSNRAGKHPGTHEIGFDSAADTITLRHVARSREGFARGALKAARWIPGRRGVFTFDDVLFGSKDSS
ncbi:MAG TPA: dihydrodipicolinate reductase C-terminal domain-containing protein [Bryobacteraceae bacterium]|jgi:4-hydroxy-tetrahydrodipicolinate reductase